MRFLSAWRTPIMIVAGLAVVAGLVVFAVTGRTASPSHVGIGLQSALASASLTFTLARIVTRRRASRQDIELLLLATALLVLAVLRPG